MEFPYFMAKWQTAYRLTIACLKYSGVHRFARRLAFALTLGFPFHLCETCEMSRQPILASQLALAEISLAADWASIT
jgi:hypothetical protein